VSAQTLLDVRGLAKRFGATTVFERIGFTLARGEMVALLGESGLGKSTLLNCIAGLEPVDAGEVRLAAQPLPLRDERALAHWRRAHLGFVFQAFHVLPHLTVAENVALPLLLLGRPDAKRVAAMLERVDLGALAERAPRTLSGGQLQRVAIARALVHAPPLVLADEPTGNLDPTNAERVIALLAAATREAGAACLLATHSAAAAARADRVLRLRADGVVPEASYTDRNGPRSS
jgi:putative ABC transport system ATP-binding protein